MILGKLMRIAISIFVSFFILNPVFAEVQWLNSIVVTFDKAKIEQKPIIVDVYTDWCTYCVILEKKIFPKPEVQSILEKFIPLRINGDKFPNFKTKFGIKGFPALIFLDKNGNFLDKLTGMPDTQTLINFMKKVHDKKDIEDKFIDSASKNPQNALIQYNTGYFYFINDKMDKAETYFKYAIKSQDKVNSKKVQESYVYLSLIYLEGEKYPLVIETWTKYIELYPNGDTLSAYYYSGLGYSKTGEIVKAKENLQKALALAKNDVDKQRIKDLLDSIKNL